MILEIVCTFNFEHNDAPTVTTYCQNGVDNPGIHCVLNECPYMSFTDAPYELAFSGANGEIDISDDANWIGFGGDMEPEGISECTRNQLVCLWREISKKKIKEAYTEYLEQMEKICAMPKTSNEDL
ncbi:MAG: hypothetical protein LBQ90_05355 [Synergistaceae bacterium]|nr:hypothetical protein [Synergistaceae bacterium]